MAKYTYTLAHLISTQRLLEVFGSCERSPKITYRQAWDSATDKNERFTIRVELIKWAFSDAGIKLTYPQY